MLVGTQLGTKNQKIEKIYRNSGKNEEKTRKNTHKTKKTVIFNFPLSPPKTGKNLEKNAFSGFFLFLFCTLVFVLPYF